MSSVELNFDLCNNASRNHICSGVLDILPGITKLDLARVAAQTIDHYLPDSAAVAIRIVTIDHRPFAKSTVRKRLFGRLAKGLTPVRRVNA